jgi:hypothetical protein
MHGTTAKVVKLFVFSEILFKGAFVACCSQSLDHSGLASGLAAVHASGLAVAYCASKVALLVWVKCQ